MFKSVLFPLAFAALVLSACSPADGPTNSTNVIASNPLTPRVGDGVITPMCVEGCLDPDPDPEAPGYFMPGTPISYAGCIASGQYDSDQDGLSDNCEINLAATFTPQLLTLNGDPTDRESRWAAKALGNNRVRIAYLLGYYIDAGNMGSSRTWCDFTNYFYPVTFAQAIVTWFTDIFGLGGGGDVTSCRGHLGDSEWIALDVEFDPDTKHWALVSAQYSAHESPNQYSQGDLEWVDRVGGRPRSWVSDGKHANYSTWLECDGGGTAGSDKCTDKYNRIHQTVNASAGLNVGSEAVPLVDCVGSTNPDRQGTGRLECYWTPQDFRGWFASNGSGGSSTGYSSILAQLGFYQL